jgi:cytochrome c556
MQKTTLARRRAGAIGMAILLTIGCAARDGVDESSERGRSGTATHAVRARKLKKIMAEIDYLRSQRLPQELDTEAGRAARIDDIRTTADSLAHAAEDIPSVLSEVRLSKSDEDMFYQLAEQLNARALELRDKAAIADPAERDAAFAAVVSTCDACHSRFRVMPAASTPSDE